MLQRHVTTADVSLCSRADELSQSNIPLQLVSGWFDATAAAAINLFIHCGQAPGQQTLSVKHGPMHFFPKQKEPLFWHEYPA